MKPTISKPSGIRVGAMTTPQPIAQMLASFRIHKTTEIMKPASIPIAPRNAVNIPRKALTSPKKSFIVFLSFLYLRFIRFTLFLNLFYNNYITIFIESQDFNFLIFRKESGGFTIGAASHQLFQNGVGCSMSHPKTWSNLFSGRGDGIRTCDFKLHILLQLSNIFSNV